MYARLGEYAANHPWRVIVGWLLVAIAVTRIAPDWKTSSQDDDIRFVPAEYPSVRGFHLLERAFPEDASASRAIFAVEREDAPLNEADYAWIDAAGERLRAVKHVHPELPIVGIATFRDGPVGKRLLSTDGRCTLLTVSLSTPELAALSKKAVDTCALEIDRIPLPEGLRCDTTGSAGIGRDLLQATASSLDHTTIATLILIVSVLALVYRAPILAAIPLITIGLAVWVSMQVLALATLIPGVHLVSISQVFAIVILFGAGTDYCLFLISRFREELESGATVRDSTSRTVSAVGHALTASAATVVCGLGMMGFAAFGKIRSAGPVIAIGLIIGWFAALTLTPALLRLGGRATFWPRRLRTQQGHGRFWEALSRWVVNRPVMAFVLSLLVLIPPAIVGLRISATYRPIGDLSPAAESVLGLDRIRQHFVPGETGPLTVLLAADRSWDSPEGEELVDELGRGFAELPNVVEVRSVVRPLGKPLVAPKNPKDLFGYEILREGAKAHYLASVENEHVARLEIITRSDPAGPDGIETLERIETWLERLLPSQAASVKMQVHGECFGIAVQARDMARLVARDRLIVNVLVLFGVFAILMLVVRRWLVAVFLLGTVLLGYFATLGLTAVFTAITTGQPFGILEWRVPFFLFIILVAVGEDYNILIVSRILQERRTHGIREGTRRGIAATGGTITACGIIMAGTFGTLLLAGLSTLQQIGFALAVGVLLDTFLIRPLLVPAFLMMLDGDAEAEVFPAKPLERAA